MERRGRLAALKVIAKRSVTDQCPAYPSASPGTVIAGTILGWHQQHMMHTPNNMLDMPAHQSTVHKSSRSLMTTAAVLSVSAVERQTGAKGAFQRHIQHCQSRPVLLLQPHPAWDSD